MSLTYHTVKEVTHIIKFYNYYYKLIRINCCQIYVLFKFIHIMKSNMYIITRVSDTHHQIKYVLLK